jgi:hypothetical protein
MRKGFLAYGILIMLVAAFIPTLVTAQQPRRTTPAASTARDLRIKYRTTTSGQTHETTTMLKGKRERNETRMGHMDMASITQCDLKRTIQISENVRKYLITPMETGAASSPGTTTPASGSAEPARRGGVVTYVTGAVDTGERKEMFGFTARRVKSSMTMDSSPDACNPMKMRTETDGWYIDLSFGLECDLGRPQMMASPAMAGGCQDRVQTRRTGAARTGYALSETTTMYGPTGSVMYTMTREVIDLSREPLDASLFDVPAGYTEAASSQELYAAPAMGDTTGQGAMSGEQPSQDQPAMTGAPGDSKAPGTIRVGVVQINNRTDRAVSLDSLRERLINDIRGGNVEAIALNAISPAQAEAEARAKHCDFILYTDIATLKASKLGGMFGRVAGVSGVGKTESKLEFKLFAVGESSPRLQSTAAAKEEGDDASVGTAVAQEARAVSAEVRRN